MPIDIILLSAAFLTGLLGSTHCVLMCGGIATAVPAQVKTSPFKNALALNASRVLAYTLAGLVVGSISTGFIQLLPIEALSIMARAAVGIVLLLVAIRLLDTKAKFAWLNKPNQWLWRFIQPLQKHLPQNPGLRMLSQGFLWGFLPCGLSGTMLIAAWLSASPLQASLIMLSFGLGTLPAMTALSWSGVRLSSVLMKPKNRVIGSSVIAGAGLITLFAPWLSAIPFLHSSLTALGCRSVL
jgi:sulfite exporter TauE/SafE